MTDQWMALKVVLHPLAPLGDRPHSEEMIKGALAILMSKYFHDEWSIILGISLVPIWRHKKCMNMIYMCSTPLFARLSSIVLLINSNWSHKHLV